MMRLERNQACPSSEVPSVVMIPMRSIVEPLLVVRDRKVNRQVGLRPFLGRSLVRYDPATGTVFWPECTLKKGGEIAGRDGLLPWSKLPRKFDLARALRQTGVRPVLEMKWQALGSVEEAVVRTKQVLSEVPTVEEGLVEEIRELETPSRAILTLLQRKPDYPDSEQAESDFERLYGLIIRVLNDLDLVDEIGSLEEKLEGWRERFFPTEFTLTSDRKKAYQQGLEFLEAARREALRQARAIEFLRSEYQKAESVLKTEEDQTQAALLEAKQVLKTMNGNEIFATGKAKPEVQNPIILVKLTEVVQSLNKIRLKPYRNFVLGLTELLENVQVFIERQEYQMAGFSLGIASRTIARVLEQYD